jgi:predicted small lipoprotein YifL
MARVALASLALVATVALAACGRKAPPVADPVEGVPLAQQRTITRNEIGYKWPFNMGVGTIACDGGALFFRADGTTYALSRSAGTRGYANVDAIRRVQESGPPSDPVGRLTQDVRVKMFADVSACGGAGGATGSQRAAECRTRIRERAGVSETELAKIEAEGVERNWPPLPRILMSLDPISEAGRLLCPS